MTQTHAPKHPVHRALDFLLHHQAVSNPETAAEAKAHAAAVSAEFQKIVEEESELQLPITT
jgi:hypothetical protein